LALAVCLPLALFAAADSKRTPSTRKAASSKAVVPAFLPADDVPGLPRVLLIGDSISMGYTVPVRELLKGKANVHRPPVNCGPTERGLASLEQWLGTNQWAVIHFNFGLHDLKYLDEQGRYVSPEKGKQVAPLPVYEKNLREIVARLKRTGAALIWATTTPVPEGTSGRVKGSETDYNRVSEKVMKENGVAINDLHALAQARQSDIQRPHNVHFTEPGYRQLAAQVAGAIEKHLPKQAP
jgi:hypothetical protein